MSSLHTLVHVREFTIEHIATFTAPTKARKAFANEVYKRNPKLDSLDMDELLVEEAYHYDEGSIQIIHHEVQK